MAETEAGRRLVADAGVSQLLSVSSEYLAEQVALIEAEAVRAERSRLREAVAELPQSWDWVDRGAVLSLLADDEEDGR